MSEEDWEEEFELEQENKTCEFCGAEIEDPNNTGNLCFRCYMKEYYTDNEDY